MAGSTVQISGKGTGGAPQNIQIGDHGDQFPHPKAYLTLTQGGTTRYPSSGDADTPIKYIYGHGTTGATVTFDIIGIGDQVVQVQGLYPTRELCLPQLRKR